MHNTNNNCHSSGLRTIKSHFFNSLLPLWKDFKKFNEGSQYENLICNHGQLMLPFYLKMILKTS
jgi:hypothetical protein